MPSPVLQMLHVDDDPFFLEMIATAIRHHRKRWTVEGHQADSRWLEAWPLEVGDRISDFDVLILDYQLDGRCADDLIRVLRSTYDNCPPIAVVSGTLDPERTRRCLELGASTCIEKPRSRADFDHLLEQLETLAVDAVRSWAPPDIR